MPTAIPTACDQHSEILISRDESDDTIQIESFSNSSNYPYAESFTIVQM